MSVFIRLETNDLKDIQENGKLAKNAVLNLRDSAFRTQNEIKMKHELILKARTLVNSAHEELIHLVSIMPQVDPLTSLNISSSKTNTFDLDTDLISLKSSRPGQDVYGDTHGVLEKLSKRISELK
ncbi:MAG: hypothetical protein NTX24_03510 [Candidatus Pacearchaeota archaeon]|nr:hypothetical protein [Candidatus Pacearchaeota archaeon]